jgi:hypothetical protein
VLEYICGLSRLRIIKVYRVTRTGLGAQGFTMTLVLTEGMEKVSFIIKSEGGMGRTHKFRHSKIQGWKN